MKMVYICSAYRGDIEHNIKKAKEYSRFAIDNEVIPITPHLLFPQFMDEKTERGLVMSIDLTVLSKCEELWVFGNITTGMREEINYAEKNKISIKYFDTNVLKNVNNKIKSNIENTIFEYNGYHFKPERKLRKDEKKDICTFSKHIKSDTELGMCDYEVYWKKCNYSWKKFYEASCSCLDVFRCIENGKLYVPCEHELFEFI